MKSNKGKGNEDVLWIDFVLISFNSNHVILFNNKVISRIFEKIKRIKVFTVQHSFH